ncbi:MAG: hypothetical protein HFG32_13315, partial [Eubacterium sp.]|nr:hypothetical protein [Eubacterium sp.]
MGKKKVAGTQNVRCTRGDGDCGRLSRKAPARHEPVVPLSALSLSDGAVRIFLNTRGKTEWEGNRTLVEFLRYVEDP